MPTLPVLSLRNGNNNPDLEGRLRAQCKWPSPRACTRGRILLAAALTSAHPSVRPAGALEDLERALALSGGRGRTARQGFVQRGLVARLQGRDDDARRDFERAASLGSPFARRQLVLLNPYAALCNRMLADVMGQLRRPRDGR